MDLTAQIPRIPALLAELEEILERQTLVICLEHRNWLAAVMCVEPVQKRLMGAATTETEGFALVLEYQPTILVVSQELEQGMGISLIARVKHKFKSTRTLFIVDDSTLPLVEDALKYGCDGICFKSERVLPALRVVAGGGVYFPQSVADVLRSQCQYPECEALTVREDDVLKGLMLGLTDIQIGAQMGISHETVRTHVKNIYQKLGVKNRTQAVVKSIECGLLTLEQAESSRVAKPSIRVFGSA